MDAAQRQREESKAVKTSKENWRKNQSQYLDLEKRLRAEGDQTWVEMKAKEEARLGEKVTPLSEEVQAELIKQQIQQVKEVIIVNRILTPESN